jgi:hypothetical protein
MNLLHKIITKSILKILGLDHDHSPTVLSSVPFQNLAPVKIISNEHLSLKVCVLTLRRWSLYQLESLLKKIIVPEIETSVITSISYMYIGLKKVLKNEFAQNLQLLGQTTPLRFVIPRGGSNNKNAFDRGKPLFAKK